MATREIQAEQEITTSSFGSGLQAQPGCLPYHNSHVPTDICIGSDFYSPPGDSHPTHTSSGRNHMPQAPTMRLPLWWKECRGLFSWYPLSSFGFIFLYLLAINCSIFPAHQTLLFRLCFSVCVCLLICCDRSGERLGSPDHASKLTWAMRLLQSLLKTPFPAPNPSPPLWARATLEDVQIPDQLGFPTSCLPAHGFSTSSSPQWQLKDWCIL